MSSSAAVGPSFLMRRTSLTDASSASQAVSLFVDPTMRKFAADVVQLPEERYGLVFVFRVFDRVSYALVMSASRPVQARDVFRTP